MKNGLNVKIWGTRGSMAAPYPDRMVYGANTSCVSVEWEDGIAVFDCGTGIRGFGEELSKRSDMEKKELHIFISHLHLDHIIGLPFLPQIYQRDWSLHFYGTAETGTSFRDRLCFIAGPPYWPVALENAGAAIYWHELIPGDKVSLPGGCKVSTIRSNHPETAMLFRFDMGDISITYGLDCELTEEFQDIYKPFVNKSSLLFFDGMYTESELQKYSGYGHSSWEQGVKIKESCQIGTLCIMHHDWGRTDSELEKVENEIKIRHENCLFGREGTLFRYELGGMEHEN